MTLDFPDATPSLTLNFQGSKYLDPHITFERASSATQIGEGSGVVNGQFFEFKEDVPRLTDKGLLIEESRTNGLTYSTAFTNSIYAKSNVTVTDNVAVAPDGTVTASTVMENSVSNSSFGIYPGSLADSLAGDWAGSVFVKPNGRDYISIRLLNGTSGGEWHTVTFALIGEGSVTQELSAVGASYTNITRSIESVGNGWYRISVGATFPSIGAGQFWPLIVQGTDVATPTLTNAAYGAPKYNGDSTKGYYLWGAQREENTNFATSYIPTSGATATRAPDLMSIQYDNFTPWFNNAEGTFVVDVEYNGDEGDAHFFNLYGTTGGWWSVWLKSNGSLTWGQVVTTQTLGTLTAGNAYKIAYIYGVNTIGGCIDGGTVSLRAGLTNFVPANSPNNRTYFALGNPGYRPVNHYLKKYAYYPTRLPDDSLEALTS